MKRTSRWALLGVGAVMVASAAAAQTPNGLGSGIKVSKDRYEPPPPPSESRTVFVDGSNTAIDEEWNIRFTQFDIGAYGGMSEPNIAAHLATVDTLRIQLAQIGQAKLLDPRAREFAATLPNGDGPHLIKLTEIIVDEDVGAKPLAADPEVERLRQALVKFQLMPAGANFDAAYFRFQVEHYQNEWNLLTVGRPNAHDDDFEKFIDQSLPQLVSQRNLALAILTTLPSS
jgi:hypothetical protein